MNEEIEYAEMLEIPVSTVNVVRKKRRKKHTNDTQPPQTMPLKDSVIATVNDRMSDIAPDTQPPTDTQLFQEALQSEGNLDFDPVPERIDTVRLYSTEGDDPTLRPYDYSLNEGGMVETKDKKHKISRIALGVEFGLACALCGAIFLTNVFMPGSAINTFFRAIHTPANEANAKPYSEFTLTPVVSDLSDAKLNLSPTGVLSFTDECCVYPAADGTVSEITQGEDGLYTLKISHSDSFTGVINGLDTVYYAVGDSVKANVPVGFTDGEAEVQVTMYSEGVLLNCFQLTEENCLAWIATAQ